MTYYVRFNNYPELYPKEVLDVIKLRREGMITWTAFREYMRKHGISPTLALIFQGCVERGEYTVYDEEGNIIPIEELEKSINVDVYEFIWHLTLDYTKRKHHQIHIELTVEGWFEKYTGVPIPSESTIEDKLNEMLRNAFELYMKDYWHFLVKELHRAKELDEYKSSFERFEKVDVKIKSIEKPLEGEITDVEFKVARYEGAEYKRMRHYEYDLRPYLDSAMVEFLDWITAYSIRYTTRTARRLMRHYEEIKRKREEDVLRRYFSRVANITDLLEKHNRLELLYERGEIDEKTYFEFYELLVSSSRKFLIDQAKKWCESIRRTRTLGELRQLMRRITSRVTWRSEFFAPYRDYVLECERVQINKILREMLKRKEIRREEIRRRVYRLFWERKREIKRTTDDPRDYRSLITRVERAYRRGTITEIDRRRLVRYIRRNIEKVQERRCRTAWREARRARTIRELRRLRSRIVRLRRFYEPCYDAILDYVNRKLRRLELRRYGYIINKIEEKIRATFGYARVKAIVEVCDYILKLPVREQYRYFTRLIDEATTTDELEAIMDCLEKSPIHYSTRYWRMHEDIVKLYEEKLEKLAR